MTRVVILILSIYVIGFTSMYGATTVSHSEMARDLSTILLSRASVDSATKATPMYILLSRKYLQDLNVFSHKYITPLNVLTLRPEIDRTLSYHLRIQKYTLSCEITALQIILESLGIVVSEDEIFSGIPIGFSSYSAGGIWGDPDREFVGSYTGGQAKKTGYGVYEKPLAKYAQIYGLSTEIINQYSYSGVQAQVHLTSLLQKIENKNTHVLLWGDWCTNPIHEDGILSKGGSWTQEFFPLPGRNHCDRKSSVRILKWKTTTNTDVVGLIGEHAFVLLGYIGELSHPSHIIVWDTYTGRHIYSYDEWMRKWSLMQYRSLVITRK